MPPGLRGAALLGGLLGISVGPCTFAFLAPFSAVGFKLTGRLFALVLGSFALGNAAATLVVGGVGVGVGRWLKSGATATRILKKTLGVALMVVGMVQIVEIPRVL